MNSGDFPSTVTEFLSASKLALKKHFLVWDLGWLAFIPIGVLLGGLVGKVLVELGVVMLVVAWLKRFNY